MNKKEVMSNKIKERPKKKTYLPVTCPSCSNVIIYPSNESFPLSLWQTIPDFKELELKWLKILKQKLQLHEKSSKISSSSLLIEKDLDPVEVCDE